MKKKALIVVNLAGFLHFLWNDIATLQEMGYEVSVAMNENSAAGPNLIEIPKLEEMGIAHYQVEFDTKSPVSTQNIQAYKQLKLILKTNKYDLIHCHTPIVGILTRMAARKYRKTGTIVIYTTHGFTFTDKSSKKNWIVYFTAEKLMSRFCDAIITINHEDYNNAKKMHCPKTYIIPSVGLDNHRFANLRINRDEYRASFGVNSKDHMILAVGELLIYLLYDYIVKGTKLSFTGNNISKRNETPRMVIAAGIGLAGMLLMSVIVSVLSSFGFGQYLSYVTGKLSFMPNQLLIRVPQIILIIWSFRYLRAQGGDVSFFLVMEVYAVLFSQFTSVSGYGGRIALYFAIFDVIVIPRAMSALKPKKSGVIIRPIIILYYMFYWWFYFVYSGTHQTVPYMFMK